MTRDEVLGVLLRVAGSADESVLDSLNVFKETDNGLELNIDINKVVFIYSAAAHVRYKNVMKDVLNYLINKDIEHKRFIDRNNEVSSDMIVTMDDRETYNEIMDSEIDLMALPKIITENEVDRLVDSVIVMYLVATGRRIVMDYDSVDEDEQFRIINKFMELDDSIVDMALDRDNKDSLAANYVRDWTQGIQERYKYYKNLHDIALLVYIASTLKVDNKNEKFTELYNKYFKKNIDNIDVEALIKVLEQLEA